ncbi:NF-X1-type zinc finger protein NFXL1-like [Macrosteles quadrilineatus]|uniref:NF-X1-type zinc finger protein NFXL1-like n=1 Tax=Macrosteles quadrilineatus TaxID=74068 RepID=UPI0023E332DF|nr:NF-X1-type zinc finger protein NFXL1-like [Macrosteles quadrilineatus]
MSARDGRGKGNPWRGRGNQPQNNRSNDANRNAAAEDKFKKAKMHMQQAVDKHKSTGYESSSEEEDLECNNILGSVLKSYASLGGTNEDLGRTQNFLEDAFQSGAAICLVCIATVRRNDSIWSCNNCWGFFHLQCIQRWAKDSVAHQKAALDDRPRGQSLPHITWACPKCREGYEQTDIPFRYFCFCGRAEDPVYHPWLVPHSCGETCNKPLSPACGHHCLLLCHPGPCPPCPKTVKTACHCGKSAPRPQRCSRPQWSCGAPCSRLLGCGRHKCAVPCHAGPCAPCPRRSVQQCQCGRDSQERECASPNWQCDRACGKQLSCGSHVCERVCHGGACGECPGMLPRTCPCGKSTYELACTLEPPTCGDTCGRLLDCGVHPCSQRCHRDKCGVCLERVEKRCRCGLHTKEVPCQKEFLCETKCKRIKDCKRHPCNRKCCDGNCGPCEKPCSRTLTCGHHKCASVCHRGQCYPCDITVQVKCHCGTTAKTVPCGRERKTRPPRCLQPCRIPPDCHHAERDFHYCHFGSCPVCRQICDLPRQNCPHLCPKLCHSAVLVNVADNIKPAGPWELVQPQLELRALPCGDCWESVSVSCLGGHEVTNVPCYRAVPYVCGRECGRYLSCGNHSCSAACHQVLNAPSLQEAGSNCEPCASQCTFPRPEGCTHPCTAGCHPPPCAPCQALTRHRCHCTINQLFLRCGEWTSASDSERSAMLSCGNQCPKNYECGHRCSLTCHDGPCTDAELCRRKVKVTCPCRRIKREVQCATVRAGQAVIECDQVCQEKEVQELQKRLKEEEEKRLQEELRNKEELEKFEKKMSGKKKHREKKIVDEKPEVSLLARHWLVVSAVVAVGVAVTIVSMLN